MTVIQDALALPIAEPTYTPAMTLEQRYEAWREVNGHVVDAAEATAAEWFAAGHQRLGIKAIFERLRWESGVREHGNVWKLDNAMTSRVARDLLDRRPEWHGRILTRALASERAS
jgi:hypothetical protein